MFTIDPTSLSYLNINSEVESITECDFENFTAKSSTKITGGDFELKLFYNKDDTIADYGGIVTEVMDCYSHGRPIRIAQNPKLFMPAMDIIITKMQNSYDIGYITLQVEFVIDKLHSWIDLQTNEKITGEDEMNKTRDNHLVELLLSNFNTIGVTFYGSKKVYTYKVPKDMEFKAIHEDKPNFFGYAVVNVGEFKVVKVVRVDDVPDIDLTDNDTTYKWIVSKIDTSMYNEMMEKDKKAKQLLAELEKRELHNRVKKEFIDGLDNEGAKLLEDQLGISITDESK